MQTLGSPGLQRESFTTYKQPITFPKGGPGDLETAGHQVHRSATILAPTVPRIKKY